ncbi:MAG: CBS domain-containing protein, partial [Sulfolobales archaeon]
LLHYLLSQGKVPSTRAREFMSSPATTIKTDDSVARARWIMIRENISRLPVVDDSNKLAGIVTTKDIVDKLYSISSKKRSSILREEERIMALPVKEIMSYPVYSFKATDDLISIASNLLNHKISGGPVFEGENLVGVISTIDIISAVAKQFEISMPIEAKLTQDLKKPELQSMIDGILDRYVARLERITEVIKFNVSFKEEAKSQGSKIYTVTARAITKIGSFIAKESDRDPIFAVRKAVDILEERILKALKKIQESKKKGSKEE